jgi:hypothetical protein
MVAASGIEPELSALRGQRVNQLHHAAVPWWEQRCQRATPTFRVYQAYREMRILIGSLVDFPGLN